MQFCAIQLYVYIHLHTIINQTQCAHASFTGAELSAELDERCAVVSLCWQFCVIYLRTTCLFRLWPHVLRQEVHCIRIARQRYGCHVFFFSAHRRTEYTEHTHKNIIFGRVSLYVTFRRANTDMKVSALFSLECIVIIYTLTVPKALHTDNELISRPLNMQRSIPFHASFVATTSPAPAMV